MPIVFVHGLGVRPGDHRTARRREDLMRRYLGPLVNAMGQPVIRQPAWGALGAPADRLQGWPNGRLETLGQPGALVERFGLAEVADTVAESVGRWRGLPVRLVSQPIEALALHGLRRPLTVAVGDLLVWLDQRRRGLDGPILDYLANALEATIAAAPVGERLLLLGHSLGGVLGYELLARRTVPGAWLVTVGCPLPLFAELGLTGEPPEALARWLNIRDPADPLAYDAHRTWPQAEDWLYRTGALVWAHGGYLTRPSFYRRLAARLTEPGPCR